MSYEEKLRRLEESLLSLGRVAVAFSGGVDSTALLHACRRKLGKENVLAITANSESYPKHELEEAMALARQFDVQHLVVQTQELANPEYRKNDSQRCYFCKKELFTVMEQLAREQHVDSLAYGAIADDLLDFRPGAKAAKEFRVLAPFQELGFSKEDVRRYSREQGLPTAEKASFACLSSRIPHGTEVSAQVLRQVEAAEQVLRSLNFHQYRVRHHGKLARIELDSKDIFSAWKFRAAIFEKIQRTGYERVALDLRAYRAAGTLAEFKDESFWDSLTTVSVEGIFLIERIGATEEKELLRRLESSETISKTLALDLAYRVFENAI